MRYKEIVGIDGYEYEVDFETGYGEGYVEITVNSVNPTDAADPHVTIARAEQYLYDNYEEVIG